MEKVLKESNIIEIDKIINNSYKIIQKEEESLINSPNDDDLDYYYNDNIEFREKINSKIYQNNIFHY